MELEHMIDPKRQAMLDRMAKARAARRAKAVVDKLYCVDRAAAPAEPTDAPPKQKRKYRKSRLRRGQKVLLMEIEKEKAAKAEAKAAKAGNIFAGITHQPNGCPAACRPDHCVITGEGICQHPDIGGLQAYYLAKPDVQARFNAARAELQRLDTEKAKIK